MPSAGGEPLCQAAVTWPDSTLDTRVGIFTAWITRGLPGLRDSGGERGGQVVVSVPPPSSPLRAHSGTPPRLFSLALPMVSRSFFFFLPESVQDAYVWKTLDWREMLIACVHMH